MAGEPEPKFIDLNFDGHPDRMEFVDRGAGRNACNVTYDVALFNPRTKQYEHNDQLSEVGSPEAHREDKTIRGFWRCGSVDTFYVYQWKASKLVLIEQTECEFKEDGTLTTRKRLKDGKLVVVSKKFDHAQ